MGGGRSPKKSYYFCSEGIFNNVTILGYQNDKNQHFNFPGEVFLCTPTLLCTQKELFSTISKW